MSEKLWAWQCPICQHAVEDYAASDEQKVKWIWCEFCERSVEMVRLPGGRFGNAVEVAKEREK